jgi:sugar lactone lactonase YvrE
VTERASALGLETVADFVGSDGVNPQPTGVAVAPDGTVHVALFATVANRAGSGKVVRVEQDGRWEVAFDTLSFPVGLGFDRDGQLYVLELAQRYDERGGRYAPGTGRLMTIGPARYQRRTLIRELTLPAGLAFTPAGDLYLTENAFQTGPAEARLLRVPAQGLRPGA